MKTLEEIENLSPEELESKAAEKPAAVPEGLQERIRLALSAQEIVQERRRKPPLWVPFSALAVAAAAATLLILPQRGPKDTFDDPLLAYAEVEKTFQTISEKMSAGVDIAREASASVDFPQTVIDRIQSK